MNGVIAIVIKNVVNIPTELGNTRKEIDKHTTDTIPPMTNIHQGLLTASLTDTSLSKTTYIPNIKINKQKIYMTA
jgi:hypothetical protein